MTIALRADRIFTGTSDGLERGVITVVDGAIRSIGPEPAEPGIEVLSIRGGTLVPGLVDAHSHVSIVPSLGRQLDQMRLPAEVQLATARANVLADLLSGVTTMRVMGQEHDVDFRLRDEIRSGRTLGPELVCGGIGLAKPGSHGHALTAVASEAEIEALAEQNIARGAGVLKMFVTGGVSSDGAAMDECPFSESEIRVAAEVAHRHGLKLAAHAHGGEGARRAIAGGVDTLEHGALLDDGLIDLIRARHVTVVGTFSILYHPAGIEQGDGSSQPVMDKVRTARLKVEEVWRKLIRAGVRLALGTDSMHGCLAFDVAKLVELGATPPQALRAATAVAAETCGVSDCCGVLSPGMQADIMAVHGNPLEDIRALAAPLLVMRQGRIAHRLGDPAGAGPAPTGDTSRDVP